MGWIISWIQSVISVHIHCKLYYLLLFFIFSTQCTETKIICTQSILHVSQLIVASSETKSISLIYFPVYFISVHHGIMLYNLNPYWSSGYSASLYLILLKILNHF